MRAPPAPERDGSMKNATLIVSGVFCALTLTMGTQGCLPAAPCEHDDAGSPPETDAGSMPPVTGPSGEAADAPSVDYRDDLAAHPGCTTEGLSYAAASIPGYGCAARDFMAESGGAENPSAPIVLLVHGNSDSPDSWMAYQPDTPCTDDTGAPRVGAMEGAPMLAERLTSAGLRTLAVDLRFDQVDDPGTNNDSENAAKNMDHGWAVPLAQHFIRSAMEANPTRRFVVIGFSLGVTVARDAMRRLLVNEGFDVFSRLYAFVGMAGGNHGVSSFALCGGNPTMRGRVACEMGNRAAFMPTDFLRPLNGEGGAWETPCADGTSAFGQTGVCGGNTVRYTTIVMEDLSGGEQQDLFVSETSAALRGADNRTIGLNDVDETNYFFCGLFRNHYGAARSEAALSIVRDAIGLGS